MATVTTDVDFSESRGTEVNVIAWVFTGIAIATVSLKLFARVQDQGAEIVEHENPEDAIGEADGVRAIGP